MAPRAAQEEQEVVRHQVPAQEGAPPAKEMAMNVANKIKAKLAKKGELVPSPPFQYYIHTSAFLVCISSLHFYRDRGSKRARGA